MAEKKKTENEKTESKNWSKNLRPDASEADKKVLTLSFFPTKGKHKISVIFFLTNPTKTDYSFHIFKMKSLKQISIFSSFD